MASIDTLETDINRLLTGGGTIPPDALVQYGSEIAAALDRQVTKAGTVRARPAKRVFGSEVGQYDTCPRKLWFTYHKPELGEELTGNVRMKFIYGDIIEETVLTLAKAAGHKVEHEQAEIRLDMPGGYELVGHIDAVVDGVLVDVKSTTSFGMKGFLAGTGGDKFGYRAQLRVYEDGMARKGTVTSGVGWIAVDKQLGHIKFIKETKPYNVVDLFSNVVATLDTANPAKVQGRKPVPEGSSGNMKLDTECSYCVTPDTLILTSDLRWVQAGTLSVGDAVVGFGEKLVKHTKFEHATITNHRRISLPCYKVVTDKGTITVSGDHKFVTKTPSGFLRDWRTVKQLEVGYKLAWFGEPWKTDTSREGGYLEGFLDGEGSFNNNTVSWAQNPGEVADYVHSLLLARGYAWSDRKTTTKASPCRTHRLLGSAYDGYKMVGTLRPRRLLAKAMRDIGGLSIHSRKTVYATVIEVTYVGEQEVIAMETTSGTYISNGFFSHNCAYKKECFPRMRTFLYSTGPVFLAKVVREPKVMEIT
jgi:hypothetical protein